jgi:hypothetical protein
MINIVESGEVQKTTIYMETSIFKDVNLLFRIKVKFTSKLIYLKIFWLSNLIFKTNLKRIALNIHKIFIIGESPTYMRGIKN